jgi:lysophospholipase L1-like esterase
MQTLEVSASPTDGKPRYVSINAAGYRGPHFELRKPKGLTRVIVIGGSAVFDKRDSSPGEYSDWPNRVAHILRKEKGLEHIEVINAGVPGHASFDSLGRLYSQLWIYDPDYVLLYNAWNDIKYFRDLTPEKPLMSIYEPRSQFNPFIEYQGLWDRLLSYSQLYVKLRSQYFRWKLDVADEGAIRNRRKREDTYSPHAVRQYRLTLETFVDLCRNIKTIPILLTQATLVSSNNSPEDRKLIGYQYPSLTHSALVRAYEETFAVTRSVAQQKQVAILDLAKELNGHRELFSDHVHLTDKGSEEVAIRVAEFLAPYLTKQRTK